MKTTDYSKIASKYDDNKIRHYIEKDINIENILKKNKNKQISVLDLACGTGNYLVKQISEYNEHQIKWLGIDKSPDMLNVAKQKKLNAELMIGDACKIPLDDESIDYIKIRFAFHHFSDKKIALKEIYRILKKNGEVSIYNINHDYMQYSWVYKYYPQVEQIDKDRFPNTIDLYKWLIESGFETQASINTIIKKFYYKDIIEDAQNRDMSQLNLISDEEYKIGLNKIIADSKKTEYLIADIAFMDFLGQKIN
jgi:ubiquinone/menaquinone biosynthesis C-methylase UbiE